MPTQEKCSDMSIIKNNFQFYSETYSEGSNSLKEVLLLSWCNNISTRACCKGHNPLESKECNNKNNEPYIVFEFDKKTELLPDFSTVIRTLKQNEYPVDIDLNESCDKILLCIRGKSVLQESSDKFFEIIKQGLNKMLNETTNKDDLYYKFIFIAQQLLGSTNPKICFSVKNENFELELFKLMLDQDLDIESFTKLDYKQPSENICEYLKTLNSLSEFEFENLNSSYKLNLNDIEKIYEIIKRLYSEKQY